MIATGTHVLFQGDSITDAFRRPEEVNDAHQLGSGYALIAVARLQASRPELGLRFTNRGVSGHTLADLAARWDADCLDLAPEVLSILIGVNGTMRFQLYQDGPDAAGFERAYGELLTRTRAALPNVRILIVEPFLLPVGDMGKPDIQAEMHLRQAAVHRVAVAHDTTFVATAPAFAEAMDRAPAEHWAYDGIHLTAAGAHLLADQWVSAFLSQCSSPSISSESEAP